MNRHPAANVAVLVAVSLALLAVAGAVRVEQAKNAQSHSAPHEADAAEAHLRGSKRVERKPNPAAKEHSHEHSHSHSHADAETPTPAIHRHEVLSKAKFPNQGNNPGDGRTQELSQGDGPAGGGAGPVGASFSYRDVECETCKVVATNLVNYYESDKNAGALSGRIAEQCKSLPSAMSTVCYREINSRAGVIVDAIARDCQDDQQIICQRAGLCWGAAPMTKGAIFPVWSANFDLPATSFVAPPTAPPMCYDPPDVEEEPSDPACSAWKTAARAATEAIKCALSKSPDNKDKAEMRALGICPPTAKERAKKRCKLIKAGVIPPCVPSPEMEANKARLRKQRMDAMKKEECGVDSATNRP